MKPGPFSYHRPTTLEEVLDLLDEHGDEAKILSGGQSLVPMLNMRLARPEVIIDVNAIGLDEVGFDGAVVRLEALVRHRALEHDPEIAFRAPLLAAAAPHIGHPPIRVRGTIGGSIAHADPAAELPAVVLALDAVIEVVSSRGVRRLAADDFFEGPFMTAIEDDEVLVAIDVPVHDDHQCVYEELAVRAGDFAIAGVAVAIRRDGDRRIDSTRIAVSGGGSTPIRARAAEELLAGRRLDAAAIEEAGAAVAAQTAPSDDIHGSAAYRRHLATVLARRALASIASQPDAGGS